MINRHLLSPQSIDNQIQDQLSRFEFASFCPQNTISLFVQFPIDREDFVFRFATGEWLYLLHCDEVAYFK